MSPPSLDISVSQVRLMFSPDAIYSVAVASNWLYLTAGASTVVRIDLDNPSAVEDLQIPKKHAENSGPIKQLYVDHSGRQLLVVTQRNEHFYFADHKNARKELKHLSKLQGHATTAAAFYPRKKGVVLLGTGMGTLVEISVDSTANETYFRRDMKYVTELWRSSERKPIRTILLREHEVTLSTGRNVLSWDASKIESGPAASNGEIYKPVFSEQPETLVSVPSDSPGPVRGLVCSPDNVALAAVLGDSHVGFKRAGEWQILDISHANRLLLSNYHIFVLHAHDPSLTVVNMVSAAVEKVIQLPFSDEVRGVSIDHSAGTQWLFTTTDLYELRFDNELAEIWHALADAHRYDEALEVAKTGEARSYVLQAYGQHELASGDPLKGAKLLGQSDARLEPAALQVIERDENALGELLFARLRRTKLKAQQVILTSWLVELGDDRVLKPSAKRTGQQDTSTTLQILKEKGEFDAYVSVLIEAGDVAGAIAFYTAEERWNDALELIRQSEHKPSVYKFAAVLLSNEPRGTVESWMRIVGLDPVPLIPSLISYATTYRGPSNENHALRYLRFLVVRENSTDVLVYNALVTCMCLNDESDHSLLLVLREHASKFSDQDSVLRICLKYRRLESAVFIYTLMGLFEEAVMVCLEEGSPEMLDVAVDIADKQVTMNDELRKYLLREVVRRMIVVKGAEAAALRFIKLLRVDDLLAQFPDFETLNELAPEIVKSLEQTNNTLGILNADIDDSLKASQEMQDEIAHFKKRSVLIEPGEPCGYCDLPLVTRKFYVFPCQHGFHGDCIKQLRDQRGMKALSDTSSDDPLTEECVLCSEANIRTIELPLDNDF